MITILYTLYVGEMNDISVIEVLELGPFHYYKVSAWPMNQ